MAHRGGGGICSKATPAFSLSFKDEDGLEIKALKKEERWVCVKGREWVWPSQRKEKARRVTEKKIRIELLQKYKEREREREANFE